MQTGGLTDGPHSLTATATDSAGNQSPASASFDVVIDTLAPGAPAIAAVADDTGASGSDGITSDNTLLVSGTAEAGAIVELFVDGGSVGTTTADAATGAWALATGLLTEGPHSLTANATDAAGNTGAASAVFAVEIDTTAPVTPTIALASSPAPLAAVLDGDDTSQTDMPTLEGTAEAGTTVEIFDGDQSLGTVEASDGTWQFTTHRHWARARTASRPRRRTPPATCRARAWRWR